MDMTRGSRLLFLVFLSVFDLRKEYAELGVHWSCEVGETGKKT